MIEYWDTQKLFEDVLAYFIDIRERIGNHVALLPHPISLAIEGFTLFADYNDWGEQHRVAMTQRIETDYNADLMRPDGDMAPWIRAYSCLVLGALYGKFAAGDIDEAGFLLGDAHLGGFTALEFARISPKVLKWNAK